MEPLQLRCSLQHASEATSVRVREFSEQSRVENVNLCIVPRVLLGNEFGSHPLVDNEVVPCVNSAGREGCDWKGGPVLKLDVPGLQVGVEGGELVELQVGEGAEEVGTPLNAYSPSSGGLGHSDLVIQYANAIYPILGMSFAGHNLQLLAVLTCLEEERRIEVGCTKGKREIKNWESSINYDPKGSCSNRRKMRTRGLVVVP
jgi:hypothetical protein